MLFSFLTRVEKNKIPRWLWGGGGGGGGVVLRSMKVERKKVRGEGENGECEMVVDVRERIEKLSKGVFHGRLRLIH